MRDTLANPFPRRSWVPLALAAGLHGLLVLAWLAGPGRPAVPPPAEAPAARLVFVAPLRPPQPAATSASTPPPRMRRPADVPTLARPPADPRADNITPAKTSADADPLRDAAPSVDGIPSAAPTPERGGLPGDLLASSKRMAGAADRELRKGASPITAEPDRKWERFADAVAGAHVGGGNTVTLASHTAPDGVIIYRKTVGNRVVCYRSGSVGGIQGGFGPSDGHGAGTVSCPSGVSWRSK